MSRWFELMLALGGLYTAGSIGIPLVLAGFGVSRTRELAGGQKWHDDPLAVGFLVAAVVAALVLWIPAYTRYEKCQELDAASSGQLLPSLSQQVERDKYACDD